MTSELEITSQVVKFELFISNLKEQGKTREEIYKIAVDMMTEQEKVYLSKYGNKFDDNDRKKFVEGLSDYRITMLKLIR